MPAAAPDTVVYSYVLSALDLTSSSLNSAFTPVAFDSAVYLMTSFTADKPTPTVPPPAAEPVMVCIFAVASAFEEILFPAFKVESL